MSNLKKLITKLEENNDVVNLSLADAIIEAIEKDVDELNEGFRKDNMPQRLSGDEFNDLWEEKVKQLLRGEA